MNNYRIPLILFYLLFFVNLYAQQNRIIFDHYSVLDGLPSGSVTSFFMDNSGIVWIGTNNGLVSFDGHDFKVYQLNQTGNNGISGNNITSITGDYNGTIWIGTSDGGLNRLNNDGTFQRINIDRNGSGSSVDDIVTSVLCDRRGNLWVGTYKGLYVKQDNDTLFSFFNHNPDDKKSIGKNGVLSVYEDQTGEIWVSTWESGLNLFDVKHNNFKRYDKTNVEQFPLSIFTMTQSASGEIVLGTQDEGLFSFNHKNKELKKIHAQYLGGAFIRSITSDQHSNIWVGTHTNGIYVISENFKDIENYTSSPSDVYSLSDDVIFSIFSDNKGSIWIGTGNHGIDHFNQYRNFTSYYFIEPHSKSGNKELKKIIEDAAGNYWGQTESGGVFRFNIQNSVVEWFFIPNSEHLVRKREILQLFTDEANHIWVRRNSQYFKFNDKKNSFEEADLFPASYDQTVKILHFDISGNRWGVSDSAIICYHAVSGRFDSIVLPAKNRSAIWYIYNQPGNKLWIQNQDSILFYDHHQKSFIRVNQSIRLSYVLANNKSKIFGISAGNLYEFNENVRLFNKIKGDFGRINQFAFGHTNLVWLHTYEGITRYNLQTNEIKKYNISRHRNLESSIFGVNSNGHFIIGGGFNYSIVDPSKILIPPVTPQLHIKSLEVDNLIFDQTHPHQSSAVHYSDSVLTLSYPHSSFSVNLAGIYFISPNDLSYRYKLEGYDDAWQLTKQRQISFRNLKGGHYVLRLQAIGANEIGSPERKIHVHIKPPFWQTAVFKTILLLLIVLSSLFYIIFSKQKHKRLEGIIESRTKQIRDQNEELSLKADQLQQFNITLTESIAQLKKRSNEVQTRSLELKQANLQLKDVNNMKDKIISVLAHDLKNSFQVLLLTIENFYHKFDSLTVVKGKEYIDRIRQSTSQSLNLLNNLLEWARKQSGEIKETRSSFDISDRLNKIITLFDLALKNKSLQLILNIPAGLKLYGFSGMIDTVLRNIINNAIKYTPVGGKIYIDHFTTDLHVCIRVKNEGIGITNEMKKAILKTEFIHSSPGTVGEDGSGMGLILCNDFLKKSGGYLDISSDNDSTTFMIYFSPDESSHQPNTLSYSNGEEKFSQIDVHTEVSEDEFKTVFRGKTVLIVEDNSEIRNNLTAVLQTFNNVLLAENGEAGFEIAMKKVPDIIISDIIMPVKDGFWLCHEVKSINELSHIPVILLTAQNSHFHRINGYATGADAYLEKPFHPMEIKYLVYNILNRRIKNHYNFSVTYDSDIKILNLSKPESQFIDKLIEIINNNISDPEFDSIALIDKMAMSRTAFYNKIKGITGQSATGFIRLIRLKYAAQLIKNSNDTINEIAFKSGFNNREYFSKTFTAHFGMSPNRFREN